MEFGNGQQPTKRNLIEKAWDAIRGFLTPKQTPLVSPVAAEAPKDPWVEKGWTPAGGGYYMPNKGGDGYAYVDKEKIPADIIGKLEPSQSPRPLPSQQPASNLQFKSGTPAVGEGTAPAVNTGMGRNPSMGKFNVPSVVHDAIQKAATEFGVPASLLYDIALQESSFNPSLQNPQEGSTAAGLFQFTNGTWDTVGNYARMQGSSLKNWNNPDKMDPYANARAAAYLIKNGQLGRWDASKGVWGPYYKPEEIQSYYSQSGK